MNSLVLQKYAGRVFSAVMAVAGIFLMAGCGSSNSGFTTRNPVGFSNSSLSGTYVFSSQGVDASGDPLALTGALVANGNGSINAGGTIDVIDPGLSTIPTTAAQPITGGSYSVGSDGRGHFTITSSAYGSILFDFVLTSASHGLITEYDTQGTNSGTLDLQTSVTSLSQLAGPYAFSLAGDDSGGDPFATVGAFTLSSSGSFNVPGVEDFNDNGAVINEPLSGGVTLGSGTGPGTITLTTSSFPLTYDYYPIDATHWKLIETDYNSYLAGDVFSATTTTAGTMVFTMAGGTTTTSVANGGIMSYNASSVSGTEDVNNDGAVLTQVAFQSTSVTTGTVGGRTVVALSNFVPATQWVVYPYSGGLLMMEADNASVTVGAAYPQSAMSFAASQGYGLNLSGVNSNGPVNYIAQFNANTSSPNVTGALDDNEFADPLLPISLSGTYTPDSPVTGRGLLTAPTTGSLATFIGALNLEYYVVDSSTVLFLDVDSVALDGGQVGLGTFELQNSTAGAAQRALSLARPQVKAHAARQRR